MEEKQNVYDLSREWTTHHKSEQVIGMGDVNGHAGRNNDGFKAVLVGLSIGERKNQEGRLRLEFYDAKQLCNTNTWLRNADKKKITYGSGCYKI